MPDYLEEAFILLQQQASQGISPTKINWPEGIQEHLYLVGKFYIFNINDTSMTGSIDITSDGNMDIFSQNDIRIFAQALNLSNQTKIVFDGDSTNTYIAANTDNPEDLEIHADQDILLQPDADVRIFAGSTEYGTFIGSGKKIELFNEAVAGDYQPVTLWNKNGNVSGQVSLNYFLGDNSTPSNGVHSGKILVGKEQLFTSEASSRYSSMKFYTLYNGDLSNVMTLSSGGDLSILGSVNALNLGSTGDIILTNQSKIAFDGDSTNTYIAANTDNPEDLEMHSDQDILLQPDRNVRIHAGSTEYGTFISSGKKLELFNDAVDGDYQPITLWNKNSDAGGKVSLNYFLGDNGEPSNGIHSGKISVGKEQLFTTTDSTKNSSMEFHTSLNGDLANKMTLSSAGNLGIGTALPGARLHVHNDLAAPDDLGDWDNYQVVIQGHHDTGRTAGILLSTSIDEYGGSAIVHTDEDTGGKGDLVFYTKQSTAKVPPVEVMRLSSGGMIGIGSDNPRHKLDVPSIGGIIIAYTALKKIPNSFHTVTFQAGVMKTISTNEQTAKITFVAPTSQNVELQVSFYLNNSDGNSRSQTAHTHQVDTSNNTTSQPTFTSNVAPPTLTMSIGQDATYNASNSDSNKQFVCTQEGTTDGIINTSWVLTGLTAGTAYTYYIAAEVSRQALQIQWGNNLPRFIIRAVALPAFIEEDN